MGTSVSTAGRHAHAPGGTRGPAAAWSRPSTRPRRRSSTSATAAATPTSTLQTECPGWTVKDQIAHVVGVERWLDGHRDPRWRSRRTPTSATSCRTSPSVAVEVRRGRRRPGRGRRAGGRAGPAAVQLRSPGLSADTIIRGPFGRPGGDGGDDAHHRHLGARAGHPQRDRPARATWTPPPRRCSWQQALARCRRVVARDAKVEPGHAVILDVTGPVVARGRGAGRPRRGRAAARARDVHRRDARTPPPPTRGDDPSSACPPTRSPAGRPVGGSVDGHVLHASHGDEDVARRVLEALVITH